MQFNNIIIVKTNSFNEYGEEISASAGASLKCRILSEKKYYGSEDKARRRAFDLVIIVPNKAFEPYTLLAENEKLTFIYEGRTYRAKLIDKIKDFSGKTKFFEIGFEQVKDGN